jgi:hypothetical protein
MPTNPVEARKADAKDKRWIASRKKMLKAVGKISGMAKTNEKVENCAGKTHEIHGRMVDTSYNSLEGARARFYNLKRAMEAHRMYMLALRKDSKQQWTNIDYWRNYHATVDMFLSIE